ncbi:MAG: SDR family oxidoreductase [Bacteroidales bacterium]|nr:SDR family oxidoreductase [Bacteroidales bacterium]
MGRAALITGASKRIGRAMSEYLAGLGWDIIVHYNSSEKEALKFVGELQMSYPNQRFSMVKADLSILSDIESLIPVVASGYEKIELLINNASAYMPASIAKTSSAVLDKNFNIHLKSPFILIRDFANYFKSGNIVNMVDTRIVKNSFSYAAYSLSKQALWNLTKMAAFEFAPAIRVNAIAPGLILPPEGKGSDYLKKLAEKVPLKRAGNIEAIIKSLVFILENDYVTGQLIFADGGENLGYTDNY